MDESWLRSLEDKCPEGYQVKDGPYLQLHAQNVIGNIKEWDDIARGLQWALTRNPYIGQAVGTDTGLWMYPLKHPSLLIVFYRIDDNNCEVIIDDIKRLD